jgi:hypothetical protein
MFVDNLDEAEWRKLDIGLEGEPLGAPGTRLKIVFQAQVESKLSHSHREANIIFMKCLRFVSNLPPDLTCDYLLRMLHFWSILLKGCDDAYYIVD